MDGNSLLEILKPTTKLTDWNKEPKLEELKQIFDDSKKYHSDNISKINDWRDLMNTSGVYEPKKIKGRSSIQPRLIKRQYEWRYSAMSEPFLSTDKLFQVSPTTFEDVEGAKQNELLLNWQFRTKINRVKFIDEYVRSTINDGTVICRVGWRNQTIPATREVNIYEFYPLEPTSEEDEEFIALFEQLQQAAEFSQSNPRGFKETYPEEIQEAVAYFLETGIPVQAEVVGTEIEEYEEILENHPTVEVLNPVDVYLDPTCKGNMDEALFVVHAYETSRFALMREAGNYKNLDKIKWDSEGVAAERIDTDTGFKFKDKMKSRVTVFEYWGYHDINGDGIMKPVVASWIGDVLIRMEESPFPDGKLPFVVVPYAPKNWSLYGEPDAELIKDNQAITGALSRGIIDILGRSANAQTGMPMDFLDPVNQRRYENGQDYQYSPIGGLHPANAIFMHKMPEIPNSALIMLNQQSQEAESMTGIKGFSGGISGESYGRVAAGIRGALDATSKREMAILRRLAKGINDIGNKIIAMNAEFLSETEVVRVTNKSFVEIKREDLKGNFDLIVDISTAEIDDAKAQDLAFMVQTIGPIAGAQAALQLVAEIAELKRMPDVAENLRNFRQEPTEEEMMLQQLEVQKAELEVMELESRIQMNQANAARARAEAGLTDLNAQEQHQGIKHKRDMEKQKAQSQGNQALAITKELAKSQGDDLSNLEAAIGYTELTKLSGNQTTEDNQFDVHPVNNNELL